jgi:signal transduction histidine kinase
VRQAAPAFPAQSSGFLIQNGKLYQVTVTPVYVQSTGGPALINVLVAGFAVDDALARQLSESAGGSEFIFFGESREVIASTLSRAEAGQLGALAAPGNALRRAVNGREEYAALTSPLRDVTGKPIGSLAILRSFRAASLGIRQLQREIAAIWVFAVLAGLLLTYVLARKILEPVDRLDKAAAQIARGNYDHRVAVSGSDELGRLSATFNGMCQAIQDAREDLIRQERISTVGRLSSSIVHDLRNPLAAIYGGAEMLVDNDLPVGQVKRLAQNLYQASRRIQEMLQDLVNVSRGKVEALEQCCMRDVVAAACENLSSIAASQGVTIHNNVAEEIELPLERARMERVFLNLIDNALEAMPEGGEVRISAVREAASVLIRIEDTGPGIAREIRPHLFHPFVTAGKRNGLGLGLALSRQTVLDHGGELWADQNVENGARFWMRLVSR